MKIKASIERRSNSLYDLHFFFRIDFVEIDFVEHAYLKYFEFICKYYLKT